VNDTFTLSNNWLTFYRGSGYALNYGQFNVPMIMAPTTYANLPTCNSTLKGAVEVITDANSPSYGAQITSGSGSTVTTAVCNGTSWLAN
jgi:hypothetical protein